eukprot:TRINITY_DN868_c1_g1_i4.p1 TRINITY_DN868_c1_g1~~TRINITY_DN868_c1_g1_i4.p1  ORF type:complete len:618 (+),score=304.54 TRINITY_DN868_c1_g1_i4:531-2384(+)
MTEHLVDELHAEISQNRVLNDVLETKFAKMRSRRSSAGSMPAQPITYDAELLAEIETLRGSAATLKEQLDAAMEELNTMKELLKQSMKSNEAREKQRGAVDGPLRSNEKPPTGTVSLVFTDVQSSTSLWEAHPNDMSLALSTHNSIMRSVAKNFNGYEVKTEGDAFMLAFSDPKMAVKFTMATQEALVHAVWPELIVNTKFACGEEDANGFLIFKGLRVRMGIHVGQPLCQTDPMSGRMDYFGRMVNLSARVSGAAHGGQTLITQAILDEIKDDEVLMHSIAMTPMGSHKLKDIVENVEMYQILPKVFSLRQFPPVKSIGNENLKALERQNTTVEILGSQVEALSVDKQALLEKLNTLESRLSEITSDAAGFAKKLDDVKTAGSQAAGIDVVRMQQEFAEMLRKQDETRLEFYRVNENREKIDAQVDALRSKFASVKKADDEKLDLLTAELAEVKRKLDESRKSTDKKVKSEKSKYQMQVQGLTDQLAAAKSSLQRKQMVVDALKKQLKAVAPATRPEDYDEASLSAQPSYNRGSRPQSNYAPNDDPDNPTSDRSGPSDPSLLVQMERDRETISKLQLDLAHAKEQIEVLKNVAFGVQKKGAQKEVADLKITGNTRS